MRPSWRGPFDNRRRRSSVAALTRVATYIIGIFGLLLGAGWIIRLAQIALGMRSVPDLRAADWDLAVSDRLWPRVSIIVPARNEEQAIEGAMGSLLAVDYPNYEVIAVNDRSTDRTPEILNRLAASERLRVLHISELPPRWLGKAHAMATGLARASGDWVLFTDADVFFRPDTLRRAITYAERSAADHLVLFPTMLMETWAERMVGGFFECMFLLWWGHSPWKVADPKSRDYLGAGAFNLVKRSTLAAIGGMEPLRMEVIEDMKLGKLVKRAGFQQRIVFGRDLITLHWARGAFGVVRNLTKNFFALVNYRWPLALGAVVVVLAVNVAPFLGAIAGPGWTRLGYIAAIGCIAAMYMGMGRYSSIAPGYFLLHPVGAVLIAYSILRSAVLTLWRNGVVWRETKYPLEELRRGIV